MKKAEKNLDLMNGFRRLSHTQRLERLKEFCSLSDDDLAVLSGANPLPLEIAENLIENVVGFFPVPLGMATHFVIDGEPMMIPMAVEETSIVAAASASAKWIQTHGGAIHTYSKGNLIIGQIQFPQVRNVPAARNALLAHRETILRVANSCVPGLVARGGGVREISVRDLPRPSGDGHMLVLHVLCDPCDAMGANLINQVCEALKPIVEEMTGEQVGLCILSNLVDTKLAGAEVVVPNVEESVGRGIAEAALFAKADPYRATTHNKGVLNGIDPILIATGNDWRAVESGVHAYASRSGRYMPVTDWYMRGPDLVGRIEVPLVVGTVGGVTRVHPTARVALKILQATSAERLSRICAAAGLVQNLGALKALATVGIVKGHMELHAANLAIAAGADAHEVRQVRERLTDILRTEKRINLSQAQQILSELRSGKGAR